MLGLFGGDDDCEMEPQDSSPTEKEDKARSKPATSKPSSSSGPDIKLKVVDAMSKSKFSVVISPSYTVGYLKYKITEVSGLPVSEYKVWHGDKVLKRVETLASYGLKSGDTVTYKRHKAKKEPKRPVEEQEDIGVWGTHEHSPGVDLLSQSLSPLFDSPCTLSHKRTLTENESLASSSHKLTEHSLSHSSSPLSVSPSHTLSQASPSHDLSLTDTSSLRELVQRVKEAKGMIDVTSNMFINHTEAVLDAKTCESLITHIEQEYERMQECERRSVLTSHIQQDNERRSEDFQVTLSISQLKDLLTTEIVIQLQRVFDSRIDEIRLRRVSAYGKHINFHTDYSLKTMQVSLSETSQYKGGRLVYVSDKGEIHMPVRVRGSVIVHDNTIVHGVTTMESGVRYSLFFLTK